MSFQARPAAAVVLIIMDSQLRVLEPVRRAVSVAIYPFQRAVMAPRDLVQQVNEWVNAANLIRSENEALQRQRIELAQVASHGAQLAAENAQLRRLLGVTDTVAQSAVVVEVLYEPTSAFNQRLVFNRAARPAWRRACRHRRRRRGRPDRARYPDDGRSRPGDRRAGVHPVQLLRDGCG